MLFSRIVYPPTLEYIALSLCLINTKASFIFHILYLAKPLSKQQDHIYESKIVQCAEYVVKGLDI